MFRGRGGVAGLAHHAVEPLEHAPARRQGGIEVHGGQQRFDGAWRVLQLDPAKPAFLMQAAEARLQPLEPGQRRLRLLDPAQMAQADGGDQKQVAVLGIPSQLRLGGGQGGYMVAALLQPTQPRHLLFKGRRRRQFDRDGHGYRDQEGQPCLPPLSNSSVTNGPSRWR